MGVMFAGVVGNVVPSAVRGIMAATGVDICGGNEGVGAPAVGACRQEFHRFGRWRRRRWHWAI